MARWFILDSLKITSHSIDLETSLHVSKPFIQTFINVTNTIKLVKLA